MYLVPGTIQFDRAAILSAAHESARLYAGACRGYRHALRQGMRDTWASAAAERGMYALRGGTREDSPELRAIRRQILLLQMRDRLDDSAYAEISRLRGEAAALEQAA